MRHAPYLDFASGANRTMNRLPIYDIHSLKISSTKIIFIEREFHIYFWRYLSLLYFNVINSSCGSLV